MKQPRSLVAGNRATNLAHSTSLLALPCHATRNMQLNHRYIRSDARLRSKFLCPRRINASLASFNIINGQNVTSLVTKNDICPDAPWESVICVLAVETKRTFNTANSDTRQ